MRKDATTSRRRFLSCAGSVPVGLLGTYFLGQAEAQQCSPTTADVEGPYYLPYAPRRTDLAGPKEPGQRLIIRGKVSGAGCKSPISGVLLDIWQADTNGQYHNENENYRLRGQMLTDKSGAYEFASIVPGRYQQGGGFRPAHIHFVATHPDFKDLTTQLYFKGDPYLSPNDSCREACKSNDPNRIIELTPRQQSGEVWFEGRFDIILSPGQQG